MTFDVDGDVLALTVTREDRTSFRLGTDTHEYVATDIDKTPTTGRQGASGYIASITSSSQILTGVMAEWSTGYGDWLVGGYWIYSTIESGDITDVEIGAYVDGPEISGTPILPDAGSATYEGVTGGMYISKYGTDSYYEGAAEGTIEVGEYGGLVSLTANFGTSRISGRVYNLFSEGIAETPAGDVYGTYGSPVAGEEIRLGALDINPDGTFRGSGVDTVIPGIVIKTSEGSWGGKFSDIDDQYGDPRMIAGTYGASVTTEGGAEVAYVGAFYGATGLFQ